VKLHFRRGFLKKKFLVKIIIFEVKATGIESFVVSFILELSKQSEELWFQSKSVSEV
jgi:hypothetical protein